MVSMLAQPKSTSLHHHLSPK